MTIQRMTGLLLICFSFLLAGCIEKVSDEDETVYGVVSFSGSNEASDKNIREIIDFKKKKLKKQPLYQAIPLWEVKVVQVVKEIYT